MDKFQIVCTSVAGVTEAVAKLPPTQEIAIIHSRGKYYIEESGGMIRINEELIFEGPVSKFKV
jgi:hypothetical protein